MVSHKRLALETPLKINGIGQGVERIAFNAQDTQKKTKWRKRAVMKKCCIKKPCGYYYPQGIGY